MKELFFYGIMFFSLYVTGMDNERTYGSSQQNQETIQNNMEKIDFIELLSLKNVSEASIGENSKIIKYCFDVDWHNRLFINKAKKKIEQYIRTITPTTSAATLFKEIFDGYAQKASDLEQTARNVAKDMLKGTPIINDRYGELKEYEAFEESMLRSFNDNQDYYGYYLEFHKNISLAIVLQLYFSSIPLIVNNFSWISYGIPLLNGPVPDLTHEECSSRFNKQRLTVICDTLKEKNNQIGQSISEFSWLTTIDCHTNSVKTKSFDEKLFLYKIFTHKLIAGVLYEISGDLSYLAQWSDDQLRQKVLEYYDLYFPSFFDLQTLCDQYGLDVMQERDFFLPYDYQIPLDLRFLALENYCNISRDKTED